MYYNRYIVGGVLCHHGILGQRWGDRNGPPYPLKANMHSKSEIKAGYHKSIKGYSNTEGKQRLHDTRKIVNSHDERYIPVEQRVFPDGRKIFPPVAKVIKDFQEDGGRNPYPGPVGFDGLYDRVNPGYGENGTKNNCPFVGAAMEVASRGYAVCARRSLGGASAGMFERWFKGAENMLYDTEEEMREEIESYGDGASGVIQGYYGGGLGSGNGGHTLHWHNENGKTIVSDGQNHTEYDGGINEAFGHYGFNTGKCICTRLDNCEPDWDAMAEDGVLGVNNGAEKYRDKYLGTIYDRF